jgi:hypothetical protein
MYLSPQLITIAYGHSLSGKFALNLLLCCIYSLIQLIYLLFIYLGSEVLTATIMNITMHSEEDMY